MTQSMADLMTKVAELQAGQTEALKDVRRLIEAGNTAAAVAAVQSLIDTNTQMDAEVEAAAPEPPAATAATTEVSAGEATSLGTQVAADGGAAPAAASATDGETFVAPGS
jgi:hypothetical protein